MRICIHEDGFLKGSLGDLVIPLLHIFSAGVSERTQDMASIVGVDRTSTDSHNRQDYLEDTWWTE